MIITISILYPWEKVVYIITFELFELVIDTNSTAHKISPKYNIPGGSFLGILLYRNTEISLQCAFTSYSTLLA